MKTVVRRGAGVALCVAALLVAAREGTGAEGHRSALLPLGQPRAHGRRRGRRRSGAELRERRGGHSRRREGAGPAVRPHATAVVLGPGQHLRPARHPVVLLAFARAGRADRVPVVPRRLRRPFQLGHGVAAHRLQRRVRVRRVRDRRQPGPHPRVLHDAGVPGAQPVGAPRAVVGRDAGHPVLRERTTRLPTRRHGHLRRRARPVRPAPAHRQPVPGAERLQLRARRGHRRAAHLRPDAVGRERGRAGGRERAGERAASRAQPGRGAVARRVVVPLRLESTGRRAAAARGGERRDSQGGSPRRLRSEALVVEGQ